MRIWAILKKEIQLKLCFGDNRADFRWAKPSESLNLLGFCYTKQKVF